MKSNNIYFSAVVIMADINKTLVQKIYVKLM